MNSQVEKNLKALKTLIANSRRATIGSVVVCPTCGETFVKKDNRQVYCGEGMSVCCDMMHSSLLSNRNDVLNVKLPHLENVQPLKRNLKEVMADITAVRKRIFQLDVKEAELNRERESIRDELSILIDEFRKL